MENNRWTGDDGGLTVLNLKKEQDKRKISVILINDMNMDDTKAKGV